MNDSTESKDEIIELVIDGEAAPISVKLDKSTRESLIKRLKNADSDPVACGGPPAHGPG